MSVSKIIIDTDPGMGEPRSDVDDGLAIALALRSPEVEVLGLTVVNGNVDVDTGTDVARRLTARLGVPGLPVLRGAATPRQRDMVSLRELFDAGPSSTSRRPPDQGSTSRPRLGPTSDESASDYLVREAAAQPGEITVIAIGPMTNLAAAVQKDGNFASNIRELVLMAGSATTYAQNVTVVGDFNTYTDPEALDIVVRSGARIRMVGLDQTSRVALTRDDVRILSGSGDEFAIWAGGCSEEWIDFLGAAFPSRPEYANGCFLHDPLVIGAFLDDSLCTWADAAVVVETTSELARGLVIADRGLALASVGPPNARVAVDTQVEAFRSVFFDRLTRPGV
jgi:purine nucleosidase